MVQVEEVMPAKTGKSLRVKLGGTWYGASLDSGLNGAKGQMIEAEISTGKFGPWINKWLPSQVAAPQVSPPLTSPVSPAVAAPVTRVPEPTAPQYAEKNTNVAPWWMPFVSNTVAHAIQAGLIKEPNQIRGWLIAAKVAAVNHDDDCPF